MNRAIDKSVVINFFNSICDEYDSHNHQNVETIHTILSYADVTNKDVLDIACGPGVLFDMYHNMNIKSLAAIDISEKMIEKCKSKFPNYCINYYCMDAEEMSFENTYDSIVLFNAFPHIAHPEVLVQKVYTALRNNGTFTIAHGSSREIIDNCHSKLPDNLSRKLWELSKFTDLLSTHFDIETAIDNNQMIIIVGRKK